MVFRKMIDCIKLHTTTGELKRIDSDNWCTWGKIRFHFYILSSLCSNNCLFWFQRSWKTRLKLSPNKLNTKRKAKERDLYKRNVLSLLIGSDHQHKRTTILSIHRSWGAISELLTQSSPLELESMCCSPCTSDLSANLQPLSFMALKKRNTD